MTPRIENLANTALREDLFPQAKSVPPNPSYNRNDPMDIAHYKGNSPIRTALVTSRNAPAHERAIKTLRKWNVHIDEAFFLGGVSKRDVLSAFGAHIFFDDQHVHADPASEVVPSAVVPYREGDNPEK